MQLSQSLQQGLKHPLLVPQLPPAQAGATSHSQHGFCGHSDSLFLLSQRCEALKNPLVLSRKIKRKKKLANF